MCSIALFQVRRGWDWLCVALQRLPQRCCAVHAAVERAAARQGSNGSRRGGRYIQQQVRYEEKKRRSTCRVPHDHIQLIKLRDYNPRLSIFVAAFRGTLRTLRRLRATASCRHGNTSVWLLVIKHRRKILFPPRNTHAAHPLPPPVLS